MEDLNSYGADMMNYEKQIVRCVATVREVRSRVSAVNVCFFSPGCCE